MESTFLTKQNRRLPRADERKEPIVTTYMPKVRHLPMFPNSRQRALRTRCGKWGWFWQPRMHFREDTKMPKLPLCKECERRG